VSDTSTGRSRSPMSDTSSTSITIPARSEARALWRSGAGKPPRRRRRRWERWPLLRRKLRRGSRRGEGRRGRDGMGRGMLGRAETASIPARMVWKKRVVVEAHVCGFKSEGG
jgi:hypothetical protein